MATGDLRTQLGEYIKQHMIYDGNGRVTDVYTARAEALNSEKCSRVQYAYLSVSSSLVIYMKETESAWDVTWEVF